MLANLARVICIQRLGGDSVVDVWANGDRCERLRQAHRIVGERRDDCAVHDRTNGSAGATRNQAFGRPIVNDLSLLEPP